MSIEDKYLKKEEIDRTVFMDDHPLWVKQIGYSEARSCNNCKFSKGPKDDLECGNPAVHRVLKTMTLDILISANKVCNYWRKL
jgi:hypothetical protein